MAVYQTVIGEGISDLAQILKEGKIDAITFTSSSTVRNLVELLKPASLSEMLKNITTACIGTITAKTIEELGGNVNLIAKEYTIAGLLKALVQYFGGDIDELE
ncbi:MAG: uroporphyrinogen-III synthase [Halanaerobiales bacterium]|nr:uroporphyrinogen-III synthase [Halanaerobiales bacterium]